MYGPREGGELMSQLGNNLHGDLREQVQVHLVPVPEGGMTTAATPIDNPDAAYLAATTKIDIAELPPFSVHEAISDGILTVTFSESMTKVGPVPEGWQTWSSPPFSEDPNPFVLISPTNILTLDLSRPVSIFGFELEPSPFGEADFTADFYLGDTLVESVNRVVDGDSGARLFARMDGRIDRVVILGPSDFAIAQVRYQLDQINQTAVLVLALLLVLILLLILL